LLVSTSKYPDLFAVLGASWGGDGATTFGIPFFADDKVPVQAGTGTQNLAAGGRVHFCVKY
jgi:microcystin-dependent protein